MKSWKFLRRMKIYEGKISRFFLDEWEVDGKVLLFEVLEAGEAVAALPVDCSGKVYLIKHYRPVVGRYLVEIPAGRVDEGEEYEFAIKRELEEEIGFRTNFLRKIHSLYPSGGILKEKLHVFLAIGERAFEVKHEDAEDIEILKFDLEELAERELTELGLGEDSVDGKTLLVLLWLKVNFGQIRRLLDESCK